MSWPKLHKTDDGCYIARIADDVSETAKYATKTGALGRMCEILHAELIEAKRVPFIPTGPCTCGGWGLPTGCLGCGLRCMGG